MTTLKTELTGDSLAISIKLTPIIVSIKHRLSMTLTSFKYDLS
ncbi:MULTISPECIES: hypothetical protein [Pseudoalteromonas]|uniref:Uncharacterized protein n=1 Tax=Pseudoalteromonas obscura TaxID=3048491 RepID=A0ABT7EFL2_9GAMM|nr:MULTISPECIES: hypothetical protein [Pseudoalteromonas]MDK2594068.1 hypothetical protein [Pseudoalteromonas sp. P94(2023)]